MQADENQRVRAYVDTLLFYVKEGLACNILGQYKQKYSAVNYMGVIQANLKHHHVSPEIFVKDDLLLDQLDLPYWLVLMLRQWNLFQPRLGKAGKQHVETLQDLRNNWAHHQHIDCASAQAGVEAAIYLLQAFGVEEPLERVREIGHELAVSPNGHSNGAAPASSATEDTMRYEPVSAEGLLLEIIAPDGKASSQPTPPAPDMARCIIGRGLHCDIRLDDPRVSRVHLMLIPVDSVSLLLIDLHSANGTTLDAAPLEPNTPVLWFAGSSVRVGDTLLVLRRG